MQASILHNNELTAKCKLAIYTDYITARRRYLLIYFAAGEVKSV
jgi:hypothetical protein